ncbi:MAG: GreA/GreB family elongation factor [Moraxellaceae bacterium]
MSRAFVKENDGDGPDDLPELPLSPHPNYVTPRGLQLLQARLQNAESERAGIDAGLVGALQQRAHLQREMRWLQARIASAQLVQRKGSARQVGFGVLVELLDEQGHTLHYRIVGEDEADPEAGLVSWLSPLAQAIEGKQVGDEVVWPRPLGNLRVEIMRIESDR